MSRIQRVREARGSTPRYAEVKFSEEEVAAGKHRLFVGGRWDTYGRRQFEFLRDHGLQPGHRVLDVGCGCFRAGRYLIDYLEPGHYFGIDASHSVVQTGYDVELSDQQRARLPVTNLRANDRFNGDFGVPFDVALAISVFPHVSLNHIQLCLYRLGKVIRPGGSFFATFFERDDDVPLDTIFAADQPKPYYHEKNAYWYRRSDLRWAAQSGPWRFKYIGSWGHPGGQKMLKFVRLTDEQVAARSAKESTKVKRSTRPAMTKAPAVAAGQSAISRRRRWAARKLDPNR